MNISDRRGLSRSEKASVDLRLVTIQRVGGDARFVMTLRKIVRTPKFDQMVFIDWREKSAGPDGRWRGDVGFTTKGRAGYAAYMDSAMTQFVNCRATSRVRPRLARVVTTVPSRCVPRGPLSVRVTTATGHFRTDAPTWSRDRHRVPGEPVVLPR